MSSVEEESLSSVQEKIKEMLKKIEEMEHTGYTKVGEKT